jgi:hypothetical protein
MKHVTLILLGCLLASTALLGCGPAPAPSVAPTIAPSEVFRVVQADADIPADQVNALAAELTMRAEVAGITGLRVVADPGGRLAVYYASPTAPAAFRALTQGAQSVRMLAVGLNPPDGRIPPDAVELWTERDVDPSSVQVAQEESGSTVAFALGPAAAGRVAEWTAAHVGEFVMLVFDGRPGEGIMINESILGGQMKLTGPSITPELAAALSFGAGGYQLAPVAPGP